MTREEFLKRPQFIELVLSVGEVSFSETLGQLYFADIEFCAESAVLAPLAL